MIQQITIFFFSFFASCCVLQRITIKKYRKDFNTIRKRVENLADKYNINEEDIRQIFTERE